MPPRESDVPGVSSLACLTSPSWQNSRRLSPSFIPAGLPGLANNRPPSQSTAPYSANPPCLSPPSRRKLPRAMWPRASALETHQLRQTPRWASTASRTGLLVRLSLAAPSGRGIADSAQQPPDRLRRERSGRSAASMQVVSLPPCDLSADTARRSTCRSPANTPMRRRDYSSS